MRRLGYRYQRTIAQPAEVRGVGFLTGAAVRLEFQPAAADTGILFRRADLSPPADIPARVSLVTGTHRRTTLGRPPAQVALVEHVLAALAGLRIDNCIVELNSPEPPGLDGSARAFVEALWQAGVVLQPARRPVWTVTAPVVVSAHGATLALHPGSTDELKLTYFLNYGSHSPIGRQSHTQLLSPERFAVELSGCRTFLLEAEALEFRRQGFGRSTTTADLLVMGLRGPIGNRLRFADELARHKVLDMVGDLALLGCDLRGHLVAYRSGHPLNVELVRTLHRQMEPVSMCRARQAA